MSNSEYLFILSNKSFNYLMIDISNSPEKKCNELNSILLPFPYIIEITKKFDDCNKVKLLLFNIFNDNNINNTNFFNISLQDIEQILYKIPSNNIDYIYKEDIDIDIEKKEIEKEEKNNENIIIIDKYNHNDIKNYDFNNVKILSCNKLKLDNIQSLKQIVLNIYNEINDNDKIKQNRVKGSYYYSKNTINSNGIFDKDFISLSPYHYINEIISQCIGNNIELILNLLLQDETTMQIQLNTI